MAELLTEVDLLSRCRHECLMPLLGYCLAEEAPCLVYPLARGGNLEDRLLGGPSAAERLRLLGFPTPPPPLTWLARVRIVRDVMRALDYLHSPIEGKPH